MWGQGVDVGSATKVTRIIPTRVGTSKSSVQRFPCPWDHPHACGDKTCSICLCMLDTGSSPRVWGQALSAEDFGFRAGIIPTRVGTRTERVKLPTTHRDHPHACGDKYYIQSLYKSVMGSSPRVWGQEYLRRRALPSWRIIPTRVGTRQECYDFFLPLQDHPHACGDKLVTHKKRRLRLGSSPRVWGQALVRFSHNCTLRIIPTRVGTRLKKSRKIAVLQNQPLRFPLTFHRSFV